MFLQCIILFRILGLTFGGRLFLAGGGIDDNNYEIWDKVVEMSGGSAARIGVVTAASSDPLDSWNFYGPLFLERGALETYWIPVHLGNLGSAYDPDVVDNINRMTGFFFGGGDQARIIESFYEPGRLETPALTAIRTQYNSNPEHMIGGSSAGTVVQVTAPMIMGGYSWESLLFGAYEWTDVDAPDYTVIYDGQGGIGFLNNFILDSHYSERGREGRLVRLVMDTIGLPNGVPYGIGIDENTALLVYEADTMNAYAEIIGEAGAMFIDTTEAIVDNTAPYPRIDNLIMHYITPGDRINLNTLDISFGADKTNLIGRESLNNAPTSDEVFDGKIQQNRLPEFLRCAVGLFDTRDTTYTSGTTWENNPEYIVDFYQTDGRAQGFRSDTTGFISYAYLVTSMHESNSISSSMDSKLSDKTIHKLDIEGL